MADRVLSGPIELTEIDGGRSIGVSWRPGCSRPPVKYSTLSTGTPCRSARMPLTHTAAVIWYSGHPTRRPARSLASRMPLAAFTYTLEWRDIRGGETGEGV